MHMKKHTFIIVCFFSVLMGITPVSAQEEILPKIDLNGSFHAVSWVYSTLGERIDREHDLDLTITYRKKRFVLDSTTYIVDNTVHTVPNSSADQYKAYWTDGGNLLVIETHVSENGVFKKDKDGNPVKSVSSFYYTPDKKHLIWETQYPQGMVLVRQYVKK